MPKFVDDLHVEGAMTAHADPAKTTQTLTAAVGQSVPIAKYFASDGSTVVFSVAVDGTVTATAFSVAGAPVATQSYVATQIANLVNSAPGILDTLGEIATALQADESTAAALATTVAGKVPLSTVTAAGDLIVASGNAAVTRLAKGAALQVFRVNSAGTGLEYVNPVSGFGLFANAIPGRQAWHDATGQAGNASPTQSQMVLFPTTVARKMTIDAMGFKCTTGAASNLMRIGHYSVSADGTQLVLAVDAGTGSAAAAANVTVACSATLPQGAGFTAFVLQGGTGAAFVAARNTTGDTGSLPIQNFGNDGTYGGSPLQDRPLTFTLSGQTGALPATINVSSLTQSSLGPILVSYRTASGWS